MDIAEIRRKILTDDEFVLEETKKIQYLYELKHETRYNLPREEAIASESVAEHIYGMHILASYFYTLEEYTKNSDLNKIQLMVTLHDIDEVETGDMIGYLKTDAIRAEESKAAEKVVLNMPIHMQKTAHLILSEYDSLKTPEAKFVKAIDRIEPIFQLYTVHGKETLHRNETKRYQSDDLKYPYIKDFPLMKRFVDIVGDRMYTEGFYYD